MAWELIGTVITSGHTTKGCCSSNHLQNRVIIKTDLAQDLRSHDATDVASLNDTQPRMPGAYVTVSAA